MTGLFANYNPERTYLEELLVAKYKKRILIFQGASGQGKTTLLQYCQGYAEKEKVRCIPIDFRGTSIAQIFYSSCKYVGWEYVTNFYKQVVNLQVVPKVQIDRTSMSHSLNSINVALSGEDPEVREYRRVALTEVWFDDLRASCQRLLFIMDTYEQATTEVKEWISGPFLARMVSADHIRVLIAGQEVPDESNIEWGEYCVTCRLNGVHEAKHWLPVVEAMDRHIPAGNAEDWLNGVCRALKGQPSAIMNFIKSLPQVVVLKRYDHERPE
jgi:energy-coupling factor transporter ATP-binding protein EcfA2